MTSSSLAAEGQLSSYDVDIDGVDIHVVEDGSGASPAVLFLHGWPESSAAFTQVMQVLRPAVHVIAIDLPGVGGSRTPAPTYDKRTLARYVRGVIAALGLRAVTLVGHDIGGQIVYAYLRAYPSDLRQAVIMNVAIPGVDPWPEVTRNPSIWHFRFHAIPGLPETLVTGREAAYFGYFYDTLSVTPDAVSQQARDAYVHAYARPKALHTGFEWYRAFAQDEKDNVASTGEGIDTPVLYVRGANEQGLDLDRYVSGLRASGCRRVRGQLIPNSGHFAPDEQPVAVASALRAFMRVTT